LKKVFVEKKGDWKRKRNKGMEKGSIERKDLLIFFF
jgi:hypothetical protein